MFMKLLYATTAGVRVSLFLLAIVVRVSGLDCVVATSFDRAFADKWTYASLKIPPYLSNRDTMYAGLPWNITLLFREYTRDYYGKTDVSYSCTILKPDGTVFFDSTEMQTVSKTAMNDTGPLVSIPIPIFSFSRNDRPGTYTISVTAYDKIIKVKKTKEKVIVLADYPKTTSHRFDDISFNVWIHSYCLDPDPGRAISAFSYFIGNKMSNNDEIFWPVFYFFQCLFSDNPALVQKLAATIPESSQRLREYTVFLLRAIRSNRGNIAYPIPDSLWKKFDRASVSGFDNPFSDAFTIKSTRLMEFGFYYYGRYSIVRFLVECLGITSPEGYRLFLNDCRRYLDNCPGSLDRETVLTFNEDAKRILKKTSTKHPLVNAYCNYAFEREHLEPGTKKTLREIIGSSSKRIAGTRSSASDTPNP